eukprot:CAMPEP_0198339062 /NCGR_PEP_ID=MMETSP1450-20131203/37699_1 /TAXON_ID=753684 ORGANISM="Madagascaria erythrocladiodes, Strain CCMP3234" /NCGR_SAMPLE_ID=MMETSP1450 /ASSEMBLY_ACC=CAM_ASM_001115 /LENGTH=539 /DNA_ID=CAMNT_0044043963 /DNA_START=64 /DNA_END=1683 /DNA_ORIENTATION=-
MYLAAPTAAVAVAVAVTVAVAAAAARAAFTVEVPRGAKRVASCGAASALYELDTASYAGDAENSRVQVVHLAGNRTAMGYCYGFMLGAQVQHTYTVFVSSVLKKWWELAVLGAFLDYQWQQHLSLALPTAMRAELDGMARGGAAAGVDDVARYVGRATVVSNFPGNVEEEIELLLLKELVPPPPVASGGGGSGSGGGDGGAGGIFAAAAVDVIEANITRHDVRSFAERVATLRKLCSQWAAWGERVNSRNALLGGRNLDWAPNTGINKHKLITVWHSDDVAHSVASFGFTGLYGMLAGVNSAHLALTESGFDTVVDTFKGFPWIWRLRYVAERAATLDDAMRVWNSTHNTLAMFHGLFSAADARNKLPHAAAIVEVMANYTAYFTDNDAREAALRAPHNHSLHMGAPLPFAVWRTNHAYDPQLLREALHVNTYDSDSSIRYRIVAKYLRDRVAPLDTTSAVNITSIIADKGGEHFFECRENNDGLNILSVTFAFATDAHSGNRAYVAWGRGAGDTWRPACCGTYVQIDLDELFTPLQVR